MSDLGDINIFKLCKICENEDSAISFCTNIGLLPSASNCPNCDLKLEKLYSIQKKDRKKNYRFQCNKKSCKNSGNNQVCLRRGTLFENSNLSIEKTLLMIYTYVLKLNYTEIIKEVSITPKSCISSSTISRLHKIFREVCQYGVQKYICSSKIGGQGKTVQIDEAKFGKQKYNRGRLKVGVWVLGGICTETGDIFLVPVEKRNKETLLPIIINHVHPGTTIVTDCWKAYSDLSSHDFEHLTVNHTYNFVDPHSGAHTQLIENTWWCIKRTLPPTYTRHGNFYTFLCEFIWRRHHLKNSRSLFEAFIKECINMFNEHGAQQ